MLPRGREPAPATSWEHLRGNLVYSAPKGIITCGATLGLGYAAAHAERSRQLLELRAELSKAQLTALRMQLNPHFFFNTLHTIGALVRDENHRGAVDMIEKLGDILRRVLRSDADPEAPPRSAHGDEGHSSMRQQLRAPWHTVAWTYPSSGPNASIVDRHQ